MKPHRAPRLRYAALALALVACRRNNPATQATAAQASASASAMLAAASASASAVLASANAAASASSSALAAPSVAPGATAAVNATASAGGGNTFATATAGTLAIEYGRAVVFRHSDGNWHARLSVRVRNTGAAEVAVARSGFTVEGYGDTATYSSFPEHENLLPNMGAEGDIAWYVDQATPRPASVTVALRLAGPESAPVWTQAVPLLALPAPPAPAQSPTQGGAALPVTAAAVVGFLNPDDQIAHVTVRFTISNPLDGALLVPHGFFHARVGEHEGSVAPWNTTLADPTPLAANGSATGTVTFYFPGVSAVPPSVQVSFGPEHALQYNAQLPVTAGAPPPR